MAFWSKIFGKRKQPEELYEVEISEKSIVVRHPKRKTESINWLDITEISLVNTDEGPCNPDVWLILAGGGMGCSIPHGSKGYDEVYEIVSKYEDFNFENVIKSMGSTNNEMFKLWQKKE